MDIIEIVNIKRKVPERIADLVFFFRYALDNCGDPQDLAELENQDELLTLARSFWDMRHGE